MARAKEIRIDIVNQETREKLAYVSSQYPDKTTQDLLDMAIDLLFREEYERIQSKLNRLLGKKADNDEKEEKDS